MTFAVALAGKAGKAAKATTAMNAAKAMIALAFGGRRPGRHPLRLPLVDGACRRLGGVDGTVAMGIFDKIKHAIFGDDGPLGGQLGGHQDAPAASPAATAPAQRPAIPMNQPAAAAPAAPVTPAQPVDVEAILTQKAAASGKPSNWRTSIVDLLTLLGLDSSLAARKELANDLNIHVGADGSADENMALHRAVMKKLAENGGKVPAELTN